MTELIQSIDFVNSKASVLKKRSGKDLYNSLFASIAGSTELYLNKSSKTVPRMIKKTKEGINKIFSRKNSGIEKLVDMDNKNQDTISREAVSGVAQSYSKGKETSISKLLKSLYANFSNFADYGKRVYRALDSTKKIDGFVKMTMEKFLKVHQYIMALVCPQWNKVTGSPEDKDTLTVPVTQKESINSDNARYETGYHFLSYRC